MLEIKNVTKIYKTKGGVNTKALDDVSISFGETGLVFLLGKSGSGKSTLLNVCGGLDEPTSGEIIVKGKSSLDFSGSDFDSYRNTFVGFIFQEYNVLDEFNVEDNIALALELQGKPKDKQKIAELLREVELESFAKRKPNTLSGGQKQRIAIARALIKEPQIIMADEPTGALDSATGKQIFDTLKNLSKTRLVIVVSHDREFAEIYGDRIVELKDGKIISDVTKTAIPPRRLDENVTVIGGNTLSIKSGSKLSQSNIKTIQDFVLSCEGDVIITKGEKQISSFKKATRMTEGGATETFKDTDTDNIELKEYGKEDSRFIRSRLPAHKAVKIGASGLKLKPIRLILTILLSIVAFTMFGLFSTLMVYDGDAVTASSFVKSDYSYLRLGKSYVTKCTDTVYDYWYYQYNDLKFTEDEVTYFTQKYGDSTFPYYLAYSDIYAVNIDVKKGKDNYYRSGVNKVAYVPEGHTLRSGLVGTYPKTPDEICISAYLLEVMNNDNSEVAGVNIDKDGKVNLKENVSVTDAQSVIGKYLVFSINGERVAFKITGVFNCGEVPAKFDELKDNSTSNTNWMLSYQFESYLEEGLFKLALVSDDFYSTYEKYGIFNSSSHSDKQWFDYCNNELMCEYDYYEYDYSTGKWYSNNTGRIYLSNRVAAFGGDLQLNNYYFGGANKTSLGDNEVIIGVNDLFEGFENRITMFLVGKIKSGAYDNDERFDFAGAYDDYDYNRKVFEAAGVLREQLYNWFNTYVRGTISKYVEDEDGGYYWVEEYATMEQRKAAFDEILKFVKEFESFEIPVTIDQGKTAALTVVGVHELELYNEGYYNYGSAGIYLSKSFIDGNLDFNSYYNNYIYETNYVEEEGQIYSGIFIAYDHTESAIMDLLSVVGEDNKKANDVVYVFNNSLYDSVTMANDMVDSLSTAFLWVGVVFAVFSALLMFNFISMTISNKRKEIGILRAVGARGLDVFKIFFTESGIITGICTVLSLIATIVVTGVLNTVLKGEIGIDVTLFVFGFVSVAMMLGIAILVAFISTFLPVYFAARKKPVDSIRAL